MYIILYEIYKLFIMLYDLCCWKLKMNKKKLKKGFKIEKSECESKSILHNENSGKQISFLEINYMVSWLKEKLWLFSHLFHTKCMYSKDNYLLCLVWKQDV